MPASEKPEAVAWDLGPYVDGYYRIITPTAEAWQARIVALVPSLDEARAIIAAHNAPPTPEGVVPLDTTTWIECPHCEEPVRVLVESTPDAVAQAREAFTKAARKYAENGTEAHRLWMMGEYRDMLAAEQAAEEGE